MDLNTVLDPSVLFISEDKWNDPDRRDEFLEHLHGNLEQIVSHEICSIYWSDELEETMWHHPQLPPWRLDRDWRLQIVPIIYKLFSKCRISIGDVGEDSSCAIIPPLSEICSEEINSYFGSLLHYVMQLEENLFFCVGLDNRLSGEELYQFQSVSNDIYLQPLVINHPEDWLHYIDLGNYWPKDCSVHCVEKFIHALHIIAKQLSLKEMNDEFIYSFQFSRRFIIALMQERKNRHEVMKGIAKRLVMHQRSASDDAGLNDEPLRGQRNTRRFRTTGACRIHYKYVDSGVIHFEDYFGEGEHDKGL